MTKEFISNITLPNGETKYIKDSDLSSRVTNDETDITNLKTNVQTNTDDITTLKTNDVHHYEFTVTQTNVYYDDSTSSYVSATLSGDIYVSKLGITTRLYCKATSDITVNSGTAKNVNFILSSYSGGVFEQLINDSFVQEYLDHIQTRTVNSNKYPVASALGEGNSLISSLALTQISKSVNSSGNTILSCYAKVSWWNHTSGAFTGSVPLGVTAFQPFNYID